MGDLAERIAAVERDLGLDDLPEPDICVIYCHTPADVELSHAGRVEDWLTYEPCAAKAESPCFGPKIIYLDAQREREARMISGQNRTKVDDFTESADAD